MIRRAICDQNIWGCKGEHDVLYWMTRRSAAQGTTRRNNRELVLFTVRVHPFPFRTRKLSSLVPKILGWRRPGKIGICQHIYSSLAQSVEHAAVNRRVVGSSPTGGARNILPLRIFRGGNIFFFPCGFSFTVCFLRVTPECCESIFGAACALRKIALIRRLFYLFVFMTALRIRQRG